MFRSARWSILGIGAFVALTGTSSTAVAPWRSRDLAASLDSFVVARVALDSFSGVVRVVNRGRVVYERAAGLADREARSPMTPSTRLQIASMTKLFTQIAVRQLEQAGKLSLDDTVGKFLPDYPN